MSGYIKELAKKVLGYFIILKLGVLARKNELLKGNYGMLRFAAICSNKRFKELKNYNDKKNIQKLRNESVIKIGFVVYTSATWNTDLLCSLLNNSELFRVSIIVGHRRAEEVYTSAEYDETINYFTEKGYMVLRAGEINNLNDYGFLFFQDPGDLQEEILRLDNIPLSILILHTSYSFMLAGNKEKTKFWMYHMAHKYYTDSAYYKHEIEKNDYYTNNTEFVGFPKMDQYYEASAMKRNAKVLIIYAPHHSVHYERYRSATFRDNYMAIFELAQKYKEDTYWVYKPHPLLRDNVVKAGIFKSVKDYDDYVNMWAMLENAEVAAAGDYFSVFKASSAMITDSVSFLAEYQFTHKPLLLLESGEEEYNEFGESIVKILYKVDGKDKAGIEQFIYNCIIGKDEMYDTRMDFFKKNLEYYEEGRPANKIIYEQLVSELS